MIFKDVLVYVLSFQEIFKIIPQPYKSCKYKNIKKESTRGLKLKKRKHIFLDDKAKIDRIGNKIKKYEKFKPYDQKTADEDFRLNEKLALLSVVASNFMMTGHSPTLVLTKREEGDEVLLPIGGGQKDRAREIISKVDFRKLYRGGKGRKTDPLMIITAICMYVMRQDNPKRGDIKYSNDFIRNVGLTKEIYRHISEKLDSYIKSGNLIGSSI